MEITENFLINMDTMTIMSFIILIITGYFLYKLITSPIRSMQFVIKGTFFLVLGFAAWFGVLCFLMYTG